MSLIGKSWADIDGGTDPVINSHFLNKAHLSTELKEFLKIPREEANNVRIFDTLLSSKGYKYSLVHYITNPPAQELAMFRGIIVKSSIPHTTDSFEIVCKSFPYTEERLVSGGIIPDFYFDKPTTSVVKSYEGTIFRVWWNDTEEEWFISTHRKINSKKSKWGGPLFGEMFNEALPFDKFDELLDKDVCYSFLLCHPNNRLVIPYSNPHVYHVGEYHRKTDKFILPLTYPQSDFTRLSYPTIRYAEKLQIKSWKDVVDNVSKAKWENESGVLVYLYPNGVIKIMNEEYKNLRDLRGNEPNLRIRWFSLKEENKEKDLEKLLPEKKKFFEKISEDNDKVIEWLIHLHDKYFKAKTQRFPREIFWVLQNYSGLNGEKTMKEVVDKYNPRVRNALIREMYKFEKMKNRKEIITQ